MCVRVCVNACVCVNVCVCACVNACACASVCGCERLSTSGSGRHQTQHGSNTALLPSNCCHSPSVLLLRYCSADQPPRARSVEASSQTHTRTHAHKHAHMHVAKQTHSNTHTKTHTFIIYSLCLCGSSFIKI